MVRDACTTSWAQNCPQGSPELRLNLVLLRASCATQDLVLTAMLSSIFQFFILLMSWLLSMCQLFLSLVWAVCLLPFVCGQEALASLAMTVFKNP